MKTLSSRTSILPWLAAAALALGLSACGPRPEAPTTSATSATSETSAVTSTAAAPTPDIVVTMGTSPSPGAPPPPPPSAAASPGDNAPPPAVALAPPGTTTNGKDIRYPEGMRGDTNFSSVIRDLPKTRGEGGALKLKTGKDVQQATIGQVLVQSAFLSAAGGTRVPATVSLAGTDTEAAFMVQRQVVREIVLVHGNSETPYAWSDADKAWIAGAPRPSGASEGPPPPAAGSPTPRP